MMRIHTTQNLSTLGTTIQPTNVVSSKDTGLKNSTSVSRVMFEEGSTVSFGKKWDVHKISRFWNNKKGKPRTDAIKRHEKLVEEMKNGDETASSKQTMTDKILDVMGHQVVVQAVISFLICTFLRPAAIMALPNKKDKRDNMYAASHSVSSGLLGLAVSFLISYPFSRGVKAFNSNYMKKLPLTILKEMFPDVSTSSIIDNSKLESTIQKITKEAGELKFKDNKSINEVLEGKSLEEIVRKIVSDGAVDDKEFWSTKNGRKLAEVINKNLSEIAYDSSEWKFKDGKRFVANVDAVQMMPATLQVSEILNQKTFEHYGIESSVDEISKYMKEHNNSLVGMTVKTKDGEKRLIDALPVKDMTLCIENLGDDFYADLGYKDVTFYPIYHIDKKFLADAVNGTDNSVLKQLDVTTAFDANGKLKHPKDWLDKSGNPIQDYENLIDHLGISSFYETTSVMPIHTGVEREAGKLASFYDNVENTNLLGVPSELGTQVTKDSIIADSYNKSKQTNVTWLPDILTRVPSGIATIILVPIILKKVFHLEKNSPAPKQQTIENSDKQNNNDAQTSPSFKGGKPNWLDKIYGEKFTVWLYKQPWFDKMSKSIVDSSLPGDMTANMAAFGSILTSGTYVARTIKNKDLDPEKRRTLTINQIINCLVPTVCAYVVNDYIKDWVDNKKKAYSASYSRRANMGLSNGKITKQEFDEFMAKKGQRLGGVKLLATLVTFTLIYRFLTPVLMTPISNSIGEKINNRKKKAAANQNDMQNQQLIAEQNQVQPQKMAVVA